MSSNNDNTTKTKEPFSSAGESTTGGSNTLFSALAAPFAGVGGLIDQVSRKVTRVFTGAGSGDSSSNTGEEQPTPTTSAPTPTAKE